MKERSVNKITNRYEIRRELETICSAKKKLDIKIGLDELNGVILRLTQDEIYLDVSGLVNDYLANDYFNERNYIYVFANISYAREKSYYNFDVEIVDINSAKKLPEQKKYLWIVKLPQEIRKTAARTTRVRPFAPVYVEIPDFSSSLLKRDSALFVNVPEIFFRLNEIDKYILLSDKFDPKEAFDMIRNELLKYTKSPDRFSFLLKGEANLAGVKELWIENTQSNEISEKEREYYRNKDIGSIVVSSIKNQLNQLEGYIIVTTPLELKGLGIIERDYIKALGARILAAYKRYKKAEARFLLKDIGEEGLAIEGEKNDFIFLNKGDILRDLKIYLDDNYVKVNGEVVRIKNNIVGLRIAYLDYSARVKIRNFIELCLSASLNA